jgi:hypothetical protein
MPPGENEDTGSLAVKLYIGARHILLYKIAV